MVPNLNKAARLAAETVSSASSCNPLRVLRSLPNVLLIAFESSDDILYGQDSLTLVDRKNNNLHYIVLYNSALPDYQLRRALARELGHVVLCHDGNSPEFIWADEADCFAFHFLCTQPVIIRFRPHHDSFSFSLKSMQEYPSMDALKVAIAEQHTRYSRYIGRDVHYTPDDVQISALDKDIFAGWKNYSSVVVGNQTVGYCGE